MSIEQKRAARRHTLGLLFAAGVLAASAPGFATAQAISSAAVGTAPYLAADANRPGPAP